MDCYGILEIITDSLENPWRLFQGSLALRFSLHQESFETGIELPNRKMFHKIKEKEKK